MNGRTFRRFKPLYLHICRVHWSEPTKSYDEIAAQLGVSPGWVSEVINSADAAEIFQRLQDKTLDTMVDVQTDLQAVAPLVLQEKISLALDKSTPPGVRDKSLTEILHMAGHQPTKYVQVERADAPVDKIGKMSESQIMDELTKGLGGSEQAGPGSGGRGPDGRPLQ